MFPDVRKGRGRVFWRAFKTWSCIMVLPGAFFLIQAASSLLSARGIYDLLLYVLYSIVVPGLLFGSLGAIALTFLASPAKKTRTLVVGVVTGFGCPVAFFGALIVVQGPKSDGTLGWVLYGIIFAGTGAFAGFEAGSAILSEKLAH